jgi:site-specific recombinase XerC
MTYSFARISAVVGMKVEDYYPAGKRWWVRLREKGGKQHEMPAHHKLEQFLDEYLAASGSARTATPSSARRLAGPGG